MIKTTPILLVLVIALFSGCNDEEKIGSILHTIRYYEDDHLGADITFSYDDQGRISETAYRDLNNPGTGARTGTLEYTENHIRYRDGAQYSEFTFDQDRLIEYSLDLELAGEEHTGTLAFTYTSGDLTGFTFEDISYQVDTDEAGNITRITGGAVDYEFSFDNKKNPLQGVPAYLFYIGLVSHTKYLLFDEIVRYFSANNIRGNGYSCEYNQGKVVKLSRDDGSITWTQRIGYKD